MFMPRCRMFAWRKADVMRRHQSPSATNGPKRTPFSKIQPLFRLVPAPPASCARKTPTLIAIRPCVTHGPRSDSDVLARRAARLGAACWPPVLAWSGQRMPTGPNVMQSGQTASSALRARHVGLPVRMPVAAEGLVHRG